MTRNMNPLARAAKALEAAGYSMSGSSNEERLIFPVCDEEESGDIEFKRVSKILKPLGCVASWTSSSDTDGSGYTTSDICVEPK